MGKENNQKLTSMGLVSYHEGLSRKDRVRLKNYVALMLGLSYAVIDGRFSGRKKFTAAELIALQPVIDGELWKQ